MVPSSVGGSLEAYDTIIGGMSKELGTFHFLPHITLIAALLDPIETIVEKTRHLSTLIAPYKFHLQDMGQKDAYFQCVFATMKLTEDVVNANMTARNVFASENKLLDPPYMPHLSLIYGDFSLEEKKNHLIPTLRHQLFPQNEGESTSLTSIIPVDAIEIWSTQGDVKDWYLVERVPLVGSKKEMS